MNQSSIVIKQENSYSRKCVSISGYINTIKCCIVSILCNNEKKEQTTLHAIACKQLTLSVEKIRTGPKKRV